MNKTNKRGTLPPVEGDVPHQDLIEQWIPFAHKKAYAFSNLYGIDENVCVSAALWGLVVAAYKWLPKRSSYQTCAGLYIDNQLRRAQRDDRIVRIKTFNTKTKFHVEHSIYSESTIKNFDLEAITAYCDDLDRMTFDSFFEIIKTLFDKQQLDILEYKIQGHSYKEIGEKLDPKMSIGSVRACLFKVIYPTIRKHFAGINPCKEDPKKLLNSQ